jgi:hypothetical protein
MAGGYESTRQQVVRLDREPEPTSRTRWKTRWWPR